MAPGRIRSLTPRQLIIVGHDAAMTAAALTISFLLRWGSADFSTRLGPIALACAITLPVALVAYGIAGLHRTPWKFIGLSDLHRLALAVAAPALFLVLLDFLSRGALIVPRTVPVIYWLVQVFLLAGPRLAYRAYRSRRRERRASQGVYRPPVIIAGTGDEADGLIGRLRRDAVGALDPVGLLTTKRRQIGERIQQVPILGGLEDLEQVLRDLDRKGRKPRRLILTRDVLRSDGVDDLLGTSRRLGLAAMRPSHSLTDVADRAEPVRLAPVSIDDLLGRPARDLDLAPLRRFLAGRRVAITGAGGSIGSELARQAAELGAGEILLIDHSELALWTISRDLRSLGPALATVQHLGSVCDRPAIERAFRAFRPDLVFHAAALKHVDIVEAHPVAAAHTNLLGTAEIAEAALRESVACAVFISTDKAVDPVSVLGATKRAGEQVWATFDQRARETGRSTRFVTVRFGNVLGSSGSVIPLFTEQLRAGGPLTVTHPEVERYFMTIEEAVRLVLTASAIGVASQDAAPAFVLDMGEPVRIVDLAHRMIRLAGLEPDREVAIAFTGLRPGEKLSEVLESAGERLRETGVPGLRASDGQAVDPLRLEAGLTEIRRAVADHDAAAVLRLLGHIVGEYRPKPESAV